MTSKVGTLLIAHPNLPAQTPFYKSVIYIFHDSAEGTQGLILNKPTAYKVNDFMAERGFEMQSTTEHLRFGGPVSIKTLFMLHSDDFSSQSSQLAGNGLMISYDDFMLHKLSFGMQPNLWRMVVGISAWQPGQLDMELDGKQPYRPENSWLTAEANDHIMFGYDGEEQWQKAMELSSQQMINQFF